METEDSLPCLQEPVTCSHLDREKYTPCHHNDFLKIHFNVIFKSTCRSSEWSLFRTSLRQNPTSISLLPFTHHVLRLSHCPWFDHLNSIQSREAFYCAVFSNFLLFSTSGPNVTLSILSSNTFILYFSFSFRAQGVLFRTECFTIHVTSDSLKPEREL